MSIFQDTSDLADISSRQMSRHSSLRHQTDYKLTELVDEAGESDWSYSDAHYRSNEQRSRSLGRGLPAPHASHWENEDEDERMQEEDDSTC